MTAPTPDPVDAFLSALRAGAEAVGLRGCGVLVAISGGADSVALLRGLHELRRALEINVSAAHLNHQLRGGESDADAEFAQELCERFDVPVTVRSEDVRGIGQVDGYGVEVAARQMRFSVFSQTAGSRGCSHVAVGHTADDQAETILHRIVRGTGLAGLRGMAASRSLVSGTLLVRPMLKITRGEVEAYLQSIGQDYRNDSSNADEVFTRNRLRHTLLPLLRREFNPQIDKALTRLGRQAGDIQDAFEKLADRLLEQAVEQQAGSICRIDCRPLQDQPRHLVRECFSRLWARVAWPLREMGFVEWDRLAELALGDGAASMPHGVQATRRGILLVLRRDLPG